MLHLEYIRSLNFVFPQNLPVIHSSVITRCRSCRTYINPFVTFTDSRRWRCPMCFRVNEGMSLQDLSYPLNILNGAVHTASSSVWSYIIMISNKWPEKKKKNVLPYVQWIPYPSRQKQIPFCFCTVNPRTDSWIVSFIMWLVKLFICKSFGLVTVI